MGFIEVPPDKVQDILHTYAYAFMPRDVDDLTVDEVNAYLRIADEAEAWCADQFGSNRPNLDWIMYAWGFLFRRADHALAFKLRWL